MKEFQLVTTNEKENSFVICVRFLVRYANY